MMKDITDYHAKYFAYELTKQCPSDSIEKFSASLSEAKVQLNPHQVDAALFAFHSPLSKGAILADEVGLGKTIEAGIILSQLFAERKRKLLIICPASLRKQWSQELLEKFYLPSVILDRKRITTEIGEGKANPFEQQPKVVICSYHFAKNNERYIFQINWDLVVIDEAHKLRNVHRGGKVAEAIQRATRQDKKILLTATPLQNSLLELYGLVSIIDPYIFGDLKAFRNQYVHNQSDESNRELQQRLNTVCIRTLRSEVVEYVPYTKRNTFTQEFTPTSQEQELYDRVTQYLGRTELLALPSGQRQLITLILRKLLASSSFAIARTLARLVTRLKNLKLNGGSLEENVLNEADISEGDYDSFEDTLEEWQQESIETTRRYYQKQDGYGLNEEIEELSEALNLAERIQTNAKGQALVQALNRGFSEMDRLGGQRKALIFTEFKTTQKYIFELLQEQGFKGKVVLFNGDNKTEESKKIYHDWLEKHRHTDIISGSKNADQRAALVDHFRNEAEIMIATEAGSEGINLQFCSLVVNYDLPWNPQRVEQRIGRAHRYGQKHDVVVVNFLNANNHADRRVLELLTDKFSLFSGVFGASDDVLGSISSGVDFERQIAQIYNDCRSPESIQSAFDELQAKYEDNIANRMKSTRSKLFEHFDIEVQEKLRVRKAEAEEYINQFEQWLWWLTKHLLNDYADFGIEEEFIFDLEKQPYPQLNLPTGFYKLGRYIEDAHHYRIGHPLAQELIQTAKSKDLPLQSIQFNHSDSGMNIAILDELVGKSGYLKAVNLHVASMENEDRIVFLGFTDDGTPIESDQGMRLFNLPAKVGEWSTSINSKQNGTFAIQQEKALAKMKGSIDERNRDFFNQEVEKLDRWIADKVKGFDVEIKKLEKQITDSKRASRSNTDMLEALKERKQARNLQEKLDELERDRSREKRKIAEEEEEILETVAKKMQQTTSETELFTIHWILN